MRFLSALRLGVPNPREFLPRVASGPVAQLGARFHGMEEVVGSIPTRSTNLLSGLAPIAIDPQSSYLWFLTCVACPYLCSLLQTRFEPFQRRPFGRVLSMGVDVHGQASVGVAQDTLSRLRVHLLLYNEHCR